MIRYISRKEKISSTPEKALMIRLLYFIIKKSERTAAKI